MLRRRHLGTVFVLTLLAEVLVFVAVVDWLGLGPALLIGLGSTLLGLSRLRTLGTAAFRRLRAAEARAPREDAFIDAALAALGAVLLILPGFVTDAIGLALLAPSVRDGVRRRIGMSASLVGAPRRPAGPQTIDLAAEDWSRLDRARRN